MDGHQQRQLQGCACVLAPWHGGLLGHVGQVGRVMFCSNPDSSPDRHSLCFYLFAPLNTRLTRRATTASRPWTRVPPVATTSATPTPTQPTAAARPLTSGSWLTTLVSRLPALRRPLPPNPLVWCMCVWLHCPVLQHMPARPQPPHQLPVALPPPLAPDTNLPPLQHLLPSKPTATQGPTYSLSRANTESKVRCSGLTQKNKHTPRPGGSMIACTTAQLLC